MLFSRANLQVVQVASTDPFDRALNGVKFEPDGSTVAGNGKVLVAVGPADPTKVHFPERAAQPLTPGDQGVVMPTDAVERAIQHLPKDRRVSLQHVMLSRVADPARVGFTSISAKGDPTTNASLPNPDRYPDWKATVRVVRGGEDGSPGMMVCLNRKDLIHMLETLDDACPDKSGNNPVFLEIGPEGKGMVARCVNQETGQHAIGAITAYNVKGQWLHRDEWERRVFDTPVAVKKTPTPLRVGTTPPVRRVQ